MIRQRFVVRLRRPKPPESALDQPKKKLKTAVETFDKLLRLLENTAADPDPRVAELSKLILQEQVITAGIKEQAY